MYIYIYGYMHNMCGRLLAHDGAGHGEAPALPAREPRKCTSNINIYIYIYIDICMYMYIYIYICTTE